MGKGILDATLDKTEEGIEDIASATEKTVDDVFDWIFGD